MQRKFAYSEEGTPESEASNEVKSETERMK
jgi:hypothetical protein